MADNKTAFKYRVFSTLIYYILRILKKTSKVIEINSEVVCGVREANTKNNFVLAFWHNKLLIPSLFYKNKSEAAILASPSNDGGLISNSLEKFGYKIIRGSSNQKQVSSLISLMKVIKSGYSIGTPLDGPKGPKYKVKPGMIYLAQKTGIPIIPTGGAYSKKWAFKKSWDLFELPKPFSKIVFIYGDPIYISKEDNIESFCELIEEKLNELNEKAENMIIKGGK